MDSEPPFDASERATEKEQSRLEDETALASGEKSREQLRRENGRIVLRSAEMLLAEAKRLS